MDPSYWVVRSFLCSVSSVQIGCVCSKDLCFACYVASPSSQAQNIWDKLILKCTWKYLFFFTCLTTIIVCLQPQNSGDLHSTVYLKAFRILAYKCFWHHVFRASECLFLIKSCCFCCLPLLSLKRVSVSRALKLGLLVYSKFIHIKRIVCKSHQISHCTSPFPKQCTCQV